MTINERMNAARSRQQQILDASRAAGNDKLTADEQREFDAQQSVIDALSDVTSDERDAGVKAENQRIAEITELGRSFGLDVTSYVQNTAMTVDQARAAVLKTLQERQTGIPAGSMQITDEVTRFRAAATDALVLKAGGSLEKAAEGANELRGKSLRDIAREAHVRQGKSALEVLRMDDETLLRSFTPVDSYPAILDAAINKSIVEAYKKAPTTFDLWTTRGSLSDFKTSKDREYVLGSFSEFKEVRENGELEMDNIATDILPTRKLRNYGKSFSMTYEAFVDDDIGFLRAIPAKFTASAKQTIEKQVYSVLFNNSTIFDGKALFHNDHKNLIGSGAAPASATLQAAILKGRMQKDQFDEPILWIPKFILTGIGYEFDMQVLFHSAQVVGSANNDINPFYEYPIKHIQVPTLNALAGANACPWFLAADPASCRHIQVDYLNGQDMPTLRRMEKAGVLGYHWDVWLAWGVSVVDFRGLVKNPGAVIS